MNGVTDAILPLSTRRRSVVFSCPTPPFDTTVEAVLPAMKSASLTSECPPGLKARKTISSCLNGVGLSRTVTPFDSFHSVIPETAFVLVATMDPGIGGEARSGCPAVRSS